VIATWVYDRAVRYLVVLASLTCACGGLLGSDFDAEPSLSSGVIDAGNGDDGGAAGDASGSSDGAADDVATEASAACAGLFCEGFEPTDPPLETRWTFDTNPPPADFQFALDTSQHATGVRSLKVAWSPQNDPGDLLVVKQPPSFTASFPDHLHVRFAMRVDFWSRPFTFMRLASPTKSFELAWDGTSITGDPVFPVSGPITPSPGTFHTYELTFLHSGGSTSVSLDIDGTNRAIVWISAADFTKSVTLAFGLAWAPATGSTQTAWFDDVHVE